MRRRLLRSKVWPALYAIPAALGFVQLSRPEPALGRARYAAAETPAPVDVSATPVERVEYTLARASSDAFGRSGEVKVLFALPGQEVEFPLVFDDGASDVTYEWTSLRGTDIEFARQSVVDAFVNAPTTPGFYYLTLIRGDARTIVSEPTLAVLRPFEEKTGAILNGYRIGTYRAEKRRGQAANGRPDGFLEVYPQHIDLPLSEHFRVSDFITQDDQANVWPKYVALSPRLLDKLELVLSELERSREDSTASGQHLRLGVHSGFRTPSHNKRVRRAARDSRHQYGDAADVGIDANWNGRMDRGDWRVLLNAVDAVERAHPDLVGGLGIYNSRRYAAPYVHIDVRGKRSRWRG